LAWGNVQKQIKVERGTKQGELIRNSDVLKFKNEWELEGEDWEVEVSPSGFASSATDIRVTTSYKKFVKCVLEELNITEKFGHIKRAVDWAWVLRCSIGRERLKILCWIEWQKQWEGITRIIGHTKIPTKRWLANTDLPRDLTFVSHKTISAISATQSPESKRETLFTWTLRTTKKRQN